MKSNLIIAILAIVVIAFMGIVLYEVDHSINAPRTEFPNPPRTEPPKVMVAK